jgi:hypothetical protein
MAHAGQHHGDAGGVGRCNDFVITHRAARLDHRRGARRDQSLKAIGEWEKRIRGNKPNPGVSAPSMPAASAASIDLRCAGQRRIHPAHLAGANAHCGAVLDIDDGIGLDVLGYLGGEAQVSQFGRPIGCLLASPP